MTHKGDTPMTITPATHAISKILPRVNNFLCCRGLALTISKRTSAGGSRLSRLARDKYRFRAEKLRGIGKALRARSEEMGK